MTRPCPRKGQRPLAFCSMWKPQSLLSMKISQEVRDFCAPRLESETLKVQGRRKQTGVY